MFARRSIFAQRADAGVQHADAGVRRASAAMRITTAPFWLMCMLAAACTSGAPASNPPASANAEAPAPSPEPAPTPEPTAEAEPTPAPRTAPELHVDASGKKPHYFFELPLRHDDLVLEGPLLLREMAYTFVDGGQFEIFVKPSAIPAAAPGCDDGVIVRMPWTHPDLPGAAAAVEVKRKLFLRIDELARERTDEVKLVVQLDPHVEATGMDPKQVSLTRCEIFFRHVPETFAYVDHLGSRSP